MIARNMIFLTGHHNAGKTTVADWLSSKYDFVHVETSKIVRNLHQKMAPNLAFHEWAESSGHKFDSYIVEEILRQKDLALRSANGHTRDIIVTGNRQIEGIRYITDNVEPLPETNHVILYLEAPIPVLHTRHLGRPDRPPLSYNEFEEKLLGFDRAMGVETIKEHADAIIANNGSKEQLFSSVSVELNSRGYSFVEGNLNGGRERMY